MSSTICRLTVALSLLLCLSTRLPRTLATSLWLSLLWLVIELMMSWMVRVALEMLLRMVPIIEPAVALEYDR